MAIHFFWVWFWNNVNSCMWIVKKRDRGTLLLNRSGNIKNKREKAIRRSTEGANNDIPMCLRLTLLSLILYKWKHNCKLLVNFIIRSERTRQKTVEDVANMNIPRSKWHEHNTRKKNLKIFASSQLKYYSGNRLLENYPKNVITTFTSLNVLFFIFLLAFFLSLFPTHI